jgi:3-phenylpropionate/trans-cinnamate dioxygenase ferredoxin subunit
VSGEGYYLKHWPVEQRDDGIYVGMEKGGGLWGLFK